jgi:glycosyltransferase involved in cell wall biosynthesis
MYKNPISLLMGFYFSPRGGSAHACRAIAGELSLHGIDVRLLAGSRRDLGAHADANRFFAGCDLVAVDFTDSVRAEAPLLHDGGPGSAPIHASYEDRPGAEDPVFAGLGDEAFELQVEAWERALAGAGADEADMLYLHHLTPINEAAARAYPELPVLGHIHGSELLMLERIAAEPRLGWIHAERWVERLCEWAGACARIVVNSPEGGKRAARLLDLDPERFVLIPNGFDPCFAPRRSDRRATWRRHLTEEPQGWRPGGDPGSVSYGESDLAPLEGTTLLYSGRFTEVKRLTLLIEAYAAVRPRFATTTALVLLGGFPGEWEGEHPFETISRLGLDDVFLAGWHAQEELPDFLNAVDVMVHASVREQFGQVLVEAMACAVPPIAVARGGPAGIIDGGRSGWLVEPDDADALGRAMLEAVNDPGERRARGAAARRGAQRRYTWSAIGASLAGELREIEAGAVRVSAGMRTGRRSLVGVRAAGAEQSGERDQDAGEEDQRAHREHLRGDPDLDRAVDP